MDNGQDLHESMDGGSEPGQKRMRDTDEMMTVPFLDRNPGIDKDIDVPVPFRAASNLDEEEGADIGFRFRYLPLNFTEEEVTMRLRDKKAVGPLPWKPGQVTFADLGGMSDTANRLRLLIRLPVMASKFYDEFGLKPQNGIVLHGTIGTGKTAAGKAILDVCSRNPGQRVAFYAPDCRVFVDGKALSDLYTEARKLRPSVVFIEHVDLLFNSEIKTEHNYGLHAAFLDALDGTFEEGTVLTIATTNDIENLHYAIRRRLNVEIFFPVPDAEARKEILSKMMSLWSGVTDGMIDMLVQRTNGYTGADLMGLARTAAELALQRANPHLLRGGMQSVVQLRPVQLTTEDMEGAIELAKPVPR